MQCRPSPFPSGHTRWARWPRACWPPPFGFPSLRPTNAPCERLSCKGRGGGPQRSSFVGPGSGSGFPWRTGWGSWAVSPCTHRNPATVPFPAVPSGARVLSALCLQARPVLTWTSEGELTFWLESPTGSPPGNGDPSHPWAEQQPSCLHLPPSPLLPLGSLSYRKLPRCQPHSPSCNPSGSERS